MVGKCVVVCGIGLALLSSACTTPALKPVPPVIPTPAFANWSQDGVADKRICVLPFTDQAATDGLAVSVRQSFAGHLSTKRFFDAELYEIDTRLNTLGGDWSTQPSQWLGQLLQCDALVYGRILTARRLYLGLYTQLTLEAEIRVIDTATGQPLITTSYATKFRDATFPLSPFGVVSSAVMNLWNMDDAQLVRAIDDLGRHLADAVPDLPILPSAPRVPPAPQIPQPLSPQPVKLPLGEGDELPVPIQAEQERYQVQVASFDTPSEAQHTIRLLLDRGYRPSIAETSDASQVRHRVLVGPFPSRHKAQQVSNQIQKVLRLTPSIVRTSLP